MSGSAPASCWNPTASKRGRRSSSLLRPAQARSRTAALLGTVRRRVRRTRRGPCPALGTRFRPFRSSTRSDRRADAGADARLPRHVPGFAGPWRPVGVAGPVVVEGMGDLLRALKYAERDTRLGVRAELRQVAEPVRADEEATAAVFLRNMPRSPQWARMRIGVTQKEIYVVPRQKGARGRGPRQRPSWGRRFDPRVKAPVTARHEPRFEREMEQAMNRIADRFNRG